MSVPTFQAIGAGTGSAGNITIALPTHQADDVLLLFIESAGGEAVSAPAGGWAHVEQSPQATGSGVNGTQLTVFWLRATAPGTTDPTVGDPGNHVFGFAAVVRGCNRNGNPFDAGLGGVKASASTSTSIPGVTTQGADRLILIASARDNDDSAANWSSEANSSLTSLTEQFDAGTTQGNGGGLALWSGVLATQGSSGTLTATSANSVIEAFLSIAFRDGHFASETLRLADVGEVQRVDHNGLKLADGPVTASLITQGNLAVFAVAETLRLADTPTPAIWWTTSVSESLKIADTPSQTLNPEQASASDALKLADGPVTAQLVIQALVTESLKVVDIGHGITSLIGTLKISDEVTAALQSFLTASVSEAVQIADSHQELLNPLQGAPTADALKIGESLVAGLALVGNPANEAVRIAESLSAQLTPLMQSAAEALMLADVVTASRGLTATASESLVIAETLAVSILIQASVSESLTISDTVSARENPLQATPSEALIVSDVISTASPLIGAVLTETLRLSDKVSILEASLNEQFILSDIGQGATQILGVVRISDTVQATVTGFLGAAPSETIRISESLTVARSALEATPSESLKIGYPGGLNQAELVKDEWVSIAESLTAAIGVPTDRFASVQETIRLVEVLTLARTLDTVQTEPLVIAEQLSASRDLTATPAESLKVVDTVTAIQDQLVTVTEALTPADQTPIGRLDPIQVEVEQATVRISETLAAALDAGGDLFVLVEAEDLSLGESLAANQDHRVVISEAIRISEQQDVEGPSLVVEVDEEALLLGESLGVEVDTLEAVLDGEDLALSDSASGVVALPTEVVAEGLGLSDADLTPAMQLAANPGGDNDLTVAVFEDCRMVEGAKGSFYGVTVSILGTYAPTLTTIGTVNGPLQTTGTVE